MEENNVGYRPVRSGPTEPERRRSKGLAGSQDSAQVLRMRTRLTGLQKSGPRDHSTCSCRQRRPGILAGCDSAGKQYRSVPTITNTKMPAPLSLSTNARSPPKATTAATILELTHSET